MIDKIIERLAEQAHKSWSGWQQYVFDKSTENKDGTYTIPKWAVERWKRQIKTAYEDLTEEEKESDRAEAREYATIVKQVAEEGGWIKCSDRLPAYTDKYGLVSDKVILTHGSNIVFGWLRMGEWITSDGFPFIRQDLIIAWQPLPKPFKESD